jgi:hypothetical protein
MFCADWMDSGVAIVAPDADANADAAMVSAK